MGPLVPVEAITSKIYLIRGMKVMLDRDLAELYGVVTKRLNEQVRRNRDRFPDDFLIELTQDEKAEVVAKCDHLHGLKYSSAPPFAYTEHGALMAAAVLKSKRAVETSIYVVRAFVKLREMIASHKEFAKRLDAMETRLVGHDENFRIVFQALKQMVQGEDTPKRKIGF